MKGTLETVATVVMAVAAASMALLYFFNSRNDQSTGMGVRVENWEEVVQSGIRVGPLDPSVEIVEFLDFQCPFCKRFHPTIDSLLAEYPDQVALIVHHYPLRIHPEATRSAIAAECARVQDRFIEMSRALFADQDSLGSVPYEKYASSANVSNLAEFSECMTLPADSFPQIQRGLDFGNRAQIRGTPTVWVNGEISNQNRLAFRVEELLQDQGH